MTNCIGQLVASNQVLYPAAFDGGSRMDLLYCFKKSGFSQDLIIREQLAPPSAWGLSDFSRLQIWTEFLTPPVAQLRQQTNSDGTVVDQEISFGQSRIGQGHAFLIGDETNSGSVFVDKHWVQLTNSGRWFLVEEVKFAAISAGLQTLPPPSQQANAGVRRVRARGL